MVFTKISKFCRSLKKRLQRRKKHCTAQSPWIKQTRHPAKDYEIPGDVGFYVQEYLARHGRLTMPTPERQAWEDSDENQQQDQSKPPVTTAPASLAPVPAPPVAEAAAAAAASPPPPPPPPPTPNRLQPPSRLLVDIRFPPPPSITRTKHPLLTNPPRRRLQAGPIFTIVEAHADAAHRAVAKLYPRHSRTLRRFFPETNGTETEIATLCEYGALVAALNDIAFERRGRYSYIEARARLVMVLAGEGGLFVRSEGGW